jgi:hypothetical protein
MSSEEKYIEHWLVVSTSTKLSSTVITQYKRSELDDPLNTHCVYFLSLVIVLP